MPCSKMEWESNIEDDWEREHKHNSMASNTAMCTLGDLVEAHRQPPDAQSFKKLSTWNAGIDNLGMLLNVAVRLV